MCLNLTVPLSKFVKVLGRFSPSSHLLIPSSHLLLAQNFSIVTRTGMVKSPEIVVQEMVFDSYLRVLLNFKKIGAAKFTTGLLLLGIWEHKLALSDEK
jgi:hypothetical protein